MLERSEAEHEQVEEVLRSSELRYQTIFETTGTTMIIVEEDMTIAFANNGFEGLTGYTREEVEGKKKWTEFIEKGYLEKMITQHRLRREGSGLASKSYEFKLVHKDGTLKDILLTANLIPGARSSVASLLDITDIKRSQTALRKSEQKYRDILENINDGYFEVDLQGNLTFFNNVVPMFTGYTTEEMMGMNYRMYVDYDNKKYLQAAFTELYQKNISAKLLNYEIIKKDGSRAKIETMVSIIKDQAGDSIGFCGISRDVSERIRMEETLRQTSRDLQEIGFIVHKSPSIAFLWRAEDNWPVEFVSENIIQFGYTPDDLISGEIPYARIIHPDDLERVAAEVVLYIGERRNEFEQEYRIVTKTGEVRWIDDRTWVRRDEQGTITHFQGIVSDINDRKQTEEALKRSEHLYRTIFENTGVANVLVHENTKIILVNSEFEKLSGFSREEIEEKKSWTEFFIEDDLTQMLEYHRRRRIDKTAAPRKYECRFRDRYGNIKDIALSVDMIPGTRESVASLHDITEQKLTERTIRESQRRLAEIIEFLPDATFVIDKQGKIIAWNRAIENLTGVMKADMIGKNNHEYALPFYGERRSVLIDYALEMDNEIEKQYTGIEKMGDVIFGEAFAPNFLSGDVHLSGTASVLRNAKGEITAAIECIRDNTERKKLEERLSRAEKMEALGTMAGGIAHDLNNVLGIMVGYSELIKEDIPENSHVAKYADSILQSSIRGAAIIQDLLTLARRGVVVSEVVDLNKLVNDYLQTPEFEKLQYYHPNVKIGTDLEDGLLKIKGSPVHLGKTIMNLVSNASEAIADHGEVMIKTANRYLDYPIRGYHTIREGDYVVLSVSDTGSGISANDLDKIFEPFYTKKVMGRSGTGLGLAVVWGTVMDHHGYIDVQSEKDKGTTFTLYFPVTREESAKVEKTPTPIDYMGKGETILVVDDVKEQRELVVSMLGRIGYQVKAVAGGEEAVEYLKSKKADLIILDMIMDPGIDGMETYRRILEINPGQKAVIVSGFSETDRVGKAQEMGAGAFVRKPYVLEKIGFAVRKELDRK
ncbi:MAG: PAS domain S-box protein [Smithella sp.]